MKRNLTKKNKVKYSNLLKCSVPIVYRKKIAQGMLSALQVYEAFTDEQSRDSTIEDESKLP
jgi:hypothetical protein